MRKVSLERYYFVLYDGVLTLKVSKMALNSLCDKTLHLFNAIHLFCIKTTANKMLRYSAIFTANMSNIGFKRLKLFTIKIIVTRF